MRKFRLGALLVSAVLAAALAACSGAPAGTSGADGQPTGGQQASQQQTPAGQGGAAQSGAGQPAGESGETVYPITLIDGAGREVTLAAEPQRILSLGPSATEAIFALGRGDRLVGRTDWCNFPEEALSVPSVGSLFPPDYERILETEPDLVVMIEGSVDVREKLEQEYGLQVFVYAPATFEQLFDQMVALGQALNAREAAEAIVAEMRAEVAGIEAKTASLTDRPVVFYVVWPDPLSTAGPGSFIDDMIRIAGGVNAAGDAGSPWPTFSVEQLIAADPDVIVAGSQALAQEILTRPGWESIKAVRNGRVVSVPNEDIVVRPGPRLSEGLRWFAATLHPDLFQP
ncbi:MAG: cobalamin-binding protein [Bacillota bacterium]